MTTKRLGKEKGRSSVVLGVMPGKMAAVASRDAVMQWVTAYVMNAAWQAAALAVCVWVMVRVTRRGGARLHYWLWVGALLLCVLLPAMPRVHLPDWADWNWHRVEKMEQAAKQGVAAAPVETDARPLPVLIDDVTTPVRVSWVGRAIFWLYGLTLLVAVGKLLRELMATRRVVRGARAFVLPEVLQRELERVRAVLRVGGVEVRSSAELRSPATVSWPGAMLLVPEEFAECTEDDAAAAMGHELAHVRRGDFWVNVLCEVMVVAVWWHPAVHWVKRRVAETREVCCDELAAEVTRGRAAYARSLVSLAENAVKGAGDLSLGVSKGRE